MTFPQSTHDEFHAVTKAWEAATDGPKKQAATRHLHAAEKARSARNDADCLSALKLTRAALS